MKIIRLGVFCEDYWHKGLIYTQNILPLKRLCDSNNCVLEIISFTSLFMYIKEHKDIKEFVKEMKSQNVRVVNFCTYYIPTRYMASWWFNIPLLFLSTFFYILYLRLFDRNKDVIYNLRSYEISFLFYKQYGRTDNLIFDPRTEWIEENINSGVFKKDGLSAKFWNKVENDIIRKFKKTIFISDIFKNNMIEKHHLQDDEKLCILYNPIDYSLFNTQFSRNEEKVFLYTGSLGLWNRLEIYLDFFLSYFVNKGSGKMIICTNTANSRVESILNNEKYDIIRNRVKVFYNVSYKELPKIYSECDYGLQLMMKKDSRVGVKVIEYIAAGLQPIVHENVQGAAYLCEKFNIGTIICSSDTDEEIYAKIETLKALDKNSTNYKKLQSLSDLNCISKLLKDIYLS